MKEVRKQREVGDRGRNGLPFPALAAPGASGLANGRPDFGHKFLRKGELPQEQIQPLRERLGAPQLLGHLHQARRCGKRAEL